VELTALRQLLAIAEAGHMTRAAQDLGVTQPTLSAMLRRLETELGVELFHRTPRGVMPTEAGRTFLDHAADAVRAADRGAEAVRDLAGLKAGTIRVGAGATAMTALLPEVVGRVRSAYPGLRFTAREAGSAAVAAAVRSGELDLGVITLPETGTTTEPPGEDLIVTGTLNDELLLIVPSEHRLATRKTFRWADLKGEPVVAFEAGSAVRDVIDAASGAHAVTLDVVVELRSIQSIERMVDVGVGVGFVSRLAGRTAGIRCADGALTRRLGVVRRSDRVPSPAVAAFERELLTPHD
jgi:DNA-binding transcriptional LysR family regulator